MGLSYIKMMGDSMMSSMIITSECEKCVYATINNKDKAKVKIYYKIKDKTYYWGQCILCEYMNKKGVKNV